MDIELMINSFPKLLNATLITLKLLSVSLILGLFIGLGFAILRMNNNKLINKFAYGYSYIFRGTPLITVVYALPIELRNLLLDNFNGVNKAANIKPIIIAVIETAIVIKVAKNNSSPQPLSPKYRSSII